MIETTTIMEDRYPGYCDKRSQLWKCFEQKDQQQFETKTKTNQRKIHLLTTPGISPILRLEMTKNSTQAWTKVRFSQQIVENKWGYTLQY